MDFGFGAATPTPEELAKPDKVFMLGRKPNRIDILTGIDGVSFTEAWASRVEAEFIAKPLFVIGRDALISNKRAAGRDKDLLDVAMLEAQKPPTRRSGVKTAGKKRMAKKSAKKHVRR